MTGAWAKACDDRQVAGSPEIAALYIGRALWSEKYDNGVTSPRNIEMASSAIRAWRKSLPEQGERIPDDRWDTSDHLLWRALGHVVDAQYYQHHGGRARASDLRHAEAMLRTWWKRQVQA